MELYYHFKRQSKLMINGIGLFFLLVLFNNLLVGHYMTWHFVKLFLLVLPVFFTANILADEYEQNREGLIFTTRTPVYRQALTRFGAGWLISEILILALFVSAYQSGLENNLRGSLVLLVNSTFLALLGLTAGNISKKSLVGYGLPFAYWVLQLAAGYQFNEAFVLFSVIINMELTEQIIWSNVWALSIYSLLLFCFNIWYIGKGEGIRPPLYRTLSIGLILTLFVTAFYAYMDYQKDILPWKILQNKQGQTVYVLAADNPKVKNFLASQNIIPIPEAQFQSTDYQSKNIVYITDKTPSASSCKLDDQGVQVGNYRIKNANAYRWLEQTPANNILYLASTSWTEEQLSYLMTEKKGYFIALKDQTCLAKTNDTLKSLKLCQPTAWLAAQKTAQIQYRNIEPAQARSLLDIWDIVYGQLSEMTGAKLPSSTLQLFYETDAPIPDPTSLQMAVKNQKDFQPVKLGGKDWARSISDVALQNILLKNIQDEKLRYAWSSYLMQTKLIPALEKGIDPSFWAINYEITPSRYTEDYLSSLKRIAEKKEPYEQEDEYYAGGYMLYACETQSQKLPQLLRQIYLSQTPLSNDALCMLLSQYIAPQEAQHIFYAYNQGKKASEAFKTARRVYE